MRLLLAAFVVLAVSLGACIEFRQRRVEVAPGTVPPEIQGARWPDLPIAYCIVQGQQAGFVDDETFVALTQRAFATWGVPTAYEGDCGHPITDGNDQNEIGWGDLEGNPTSLTEAGNTNLRYVSSPFGGAPDITEADITVHREPAHGRDTEECLFTTLLHETGHVIGLTHSAQDTVMSPVIEDCLQEPTPADRAALDALY